MQTWSNAEDLAAGLLAQLNATDWQQTIVLSVVAIAAAHVGWRSWKAWNAFRSSSAGGCGGCHGCARNAAPLVSIDVEAR